MCGYYTCRNCEFAFFRCYAVIDDSGELYKRDSSLCHLCLLAQDIIKLKSDIKEAEKYRKKVELARTVETKQYWKNIKAGKEVPKPPYLRAKPAIKVTSINDDKITVAAPAAAADDSAEGYDVVDG
jgi:hypothetical protein